MQTPSSRFSPVLALLLACAATLGLVGCRATQPPTPGPGSTTAALPSDLRIPALVDTPTVNLLPDTLSFVPVAAADSFAVRPRGPVVQRPSIGTATEDARASAEPSPPIFVNADSLSAFERDGEPLQDLIGNVFVRQDSTQLRSIRALRYLQRDSILFTGRVRLFERGDSLYADTLRYNRRLEIGRAAGNVRLTDGRVTVFAPTARYDAEAQRTVFPDSIILVDSARVLRASAGRYASDDNRAEFFGTVRMVERASGRPDTTTVPRDDVTTYMEADSVVYFRETEVMDARGDVFIERRGGADDPAVATSDRTYLFGDRIRNDESQQDSRVDGRALLVQIQTDSLGAPTDTLFTAARRLHATRTDTLRRVVATTNVRIWNAGLAAVADSAVYDRIPGDSTSAPASSATPAASSSVRRTSPALRDTTARDTARVPLDTLRADSLQTKTTMPDSVSAATDAGSSRTPSREETRLFQRPVVWFENAQITGAPIRVVARNRSLDSMYVDANAFTAQRDSATGRLQQLKGRSMVATFRRDALRRLIARPNAETIWFRTTDNGALDGAIRASGDRIELRFADGAITNASIYSGVQSTYFQAEDVPDVLELEGLQWMPTRAPTKAQFLRQPRLRRRGFDAPPDSVQPPRPSTPLDTLQTARPPLPSDTTATSTRHQPQP